MGDGTSETCHKSLELPETKSIGYNIKSPEKSSSSKSPSKSPSKEGQLSSIKTTKPRLLKSICASYMELVTKFKLSQGFAISSIRTNREIRNHTAATNGAFNFDNIVSGARQSQIFFSLFRKFKYDYISCQFMNGYDPELNRFYGINNEYYFDADTVKDMIIDSEHFLLNFRLGHQFYAELIRLSEKLNKLTKVMMMMVRYHLIVCKVGSIRKNSYMLNQ